MRVSQFWVAKQVYTVTGPVLDPSGDVVLAEGPVDRHQRSQNFLNCLCVVPCAARRQ